jgi:hypothetical protein
VLTMDAEMEFAIEPETTGKQLCEQVCIFRLVLNGQLNETPNIISGFYDNKSPGPDSIGPKLLKLISANIVEPFTYICNLSFATGKYHKL